MTIINLLYNYLYLKLCIYDVTFLEKILECMNLLMRNIGIKSVSSVVSCELKPRDLKLHKDTYI